MSADGNCCKGGRRAEDQLCLRQELEIEGAFIYISLKDSD